MELKKYQCHKQVLATPMKLGEYNTYRGWTIPENEDPEADGYLVAYTDSPSESCPSGYHESWSPKDVFDRGYADLSDFKSRAVAEAKQLEDRIERLWAFIEGEPAGIVNLPQEEQLMLRMQYASMYNYMSALTARVGLPLNVSPLPPKAVPYPLIQSILEQCRFEYHVVPNTTETQCTVIMNNGFTIGFGKSGCVNANDFNEQRGRDIAQERALADATNNLYTYEGYARAVGYTA